MISRWAALKRGLQVVSVSRFSSDGRRTSFCVGFTTFFSRTLYVNSPWRVVTWIRSPASSSSVRKNGAPYVVRWPAMAALPGCPGSGVVG